MSEPIAELAVEIASRDAEPSAQMRVADVTAVETTGSLRVQTSISGTAWLNRLQDVVVSVGDRVSILQQGPVMLVVGRLSPATIGVPIGTLVPFAGATAPTGWLLCDGAAVSRTTYAALFAVCGTTYGSGDGSTTFNLPSMTNRMPVGSGGSYSRGNTGGAATVALAIGNLPSHNHSVVTTGTTTVQSGSGATVASNSAGNTGSQGSGTAHENMPPYLAVPYIIRAR